MTDNTAIIESAGERIAQMIERLPCPYEPEDGERTHNCDVVNREDAVAIARNIISNIRASVGPEPQN